MNIVINPSLPYIWGGGSGVCWDEEFETLEYPDRDAWETE